MPLCELLTPIKGVQQQDCWVSYTKESPSWTTLLHRKAVQRGPEVVGTFGQLKAIPTVWITSGLFKGFTCKSWASSCAVSVPALNEMTLAASQGPDISVLYTTVCIYRMAIFRVCNTLKFSWSKSVTGNISVLTVAWKHTTHRACITSPDPGEHGGSLPAMWINGNKNYPTYH